MSAPAAARPLLARLYHDVGKYIALSARNLPPSAPLSAELLAALRQDLYAQPGGRASAIFAAQVAPLAALWPHPRYAELAALLAQIDGLEAALCGAQPQDAARRAAALALQVAQGLHALLQEALRPDRGRP